MTPQLKAQLLAWLYQYGPLGCVALVAAAALSSLRGPRRGRGRSRD
jgi:hypothetical protein